ncbi:MAG: hypothetical protein AAF718_10255 [Pseudomonadota bacterium]
MADRTGGEGKPGVPKEVFELDKDERWQARLDEARARREVALREKAAGKPQKPRPKPWEIGGAEMDAPKEINPIMQERGNDKFDFADRLETIRSAKSEAAPKPPAAETTPVEAPVVPAETAKAREAQPVPSAPAEPIPPAKEETPVARSETYAPAEAAPPPPPTPRQRTRPSLVLPDAPDVAELAARYASTIDGPEPLRRATATQPVFEEDLQPQHTAELVALPTAAPPQSVLDERLKSRSERRRGIRPLGMAAGLMAFAALPLTVEAPPLEIGPEMPLIERIRNQPALGVTWGLYAPPVQTSSDQWRPSAAPLRVSRAPLAVPLTPGLTEAALSPPQIPPLSNVPPEVPELALPPWDGPDLAGVVSNVLSQPETGPATFGTPIGLEVPGIPTTPLPVSTAPPAAPTPPPAKPDTQPAEVTAPTQAEEPPAASADAPVPEGSIGAPPRPPTLREKSGETVTPPARPRPSETVVEADPLRVTILVPRRADRAVTDDVASGVTLDGHELVRVKDVDFSISTRNVRYFHDEDRASAARMAARYEAELRDFTWFRPKPVEGTTELWLSGRAPGGNTNGRVQTNAEDVLERALDRLGLGRDLPESLPSAEDIRNILRPRSGDN